MNKKYLLFSLICLSSLGLGLTSCQNTSSQTTDRVDTTIIQTSKESLTLQVGETTSFTYSIVSSKTGQKITLDYDNMMISVVSISVDTVIIEGLSEGQTDLVLKTDDGTTKTLKVTITEGESITLEQDELTLNVGETKEVNFTVKPESLSKNDLTLEYDADIINATLDSNKIEISGIDVGTTDLILKSKNGATDTIKVTVTQQEILPTEISTDFVRKVIGVNEELPINVIFTPAETTNKELRYLSSNPSVATVNNGILKGVARGEAIIMISSVANPDIPSIAISISVSDDEDTVNEDKINSHISAAIENESEKITGGTVTFSSKNRNLSDPTTFSNTYQVYNDVIYNQITGYDGSTHLDYYTKYEDSVYFISKDGDETIEQQKYLISDSSYFTGYISEEEAKEYTSLPAILPYSYSQNYSYGIGNYVKQDLLDLIFFNSATSGVEITSEGENIILNYRDDSYDYSELYRLELIFENNNFKEVHYQRDEYTEDCFDEEGNLISDSTPRAYDHFDAELSNGVKQVDAEKEIDPDGFFYSDFEAKFFLTNDTAETSKTTFNVADNIIFKLESFKPDTANSVFDRVEITSVSDPDIIQVSSNKTAMIALSAGTCQVTLASKKVTKNYTLTIVTPEIESLEFSAGLTDTLASNERTTFTVERTPAGAIDDIQVELSEGAEQYVTLGMTSYGYYYIEGKNNLTEKEYVFKVIAYSESHPEVRIEKEVTLVKVLSDQEILDILTSQTFTSDVNTDYYNYYATIQFNEDRTGVFIIHIDETRVYDTCNFHWIINNHAITITEQVFEKNLFTDLSIDLDTPDLSSFTVSAIDNWESGDEYGYEYDFIMRRNINA